LIGDGPGTLISCGPRLFPRIQGSLQVEFSYKRSDPQNPLFPAVSVPLFLSIAVAPQPVQTATIVND